MDSAKKQFLSSFFCVDFSHSLEESLILPVFLTNVLFTLFVLSCYFCETYVNWVRQKSRDCVCKNQEGQSSRYFCFDFVVMEFVEKMGQFVNGLCTRAIHFRLGSSLFHEIGDLWYGVFEFRFVFDVRGGVIEDEDQRTK
jgi:hypothetical protein